MTPISDALLVFQAEMEFRTMSRRIADKLGVTRRGYEDTPLGGCRRRAGTAPFTPEASNGVRDAPALQVWVDRIMARGHVAVDTETTSLNEMQADLVGDFANAVEPGRACYIPAGPQGRRLGRPLRL